MRKLYQSVVLKQELCTKAKLFVFKSVFVPILTYGHKSWIMTKKVESRVQSAEMGFLGNVKGLSLLDKFKSTDIHQSLNIKPLLLDIKLSQLRWYGHVTQMSNERREKQLMDALPSSKRPRGRPLTRWRNYVEDLAWSRLEISPAKLPLVAGDRDAWNFQLELLSPQPQKDKRANKNTLK